MNEFNAAFDDKFLQLNNRVDKTLDAFLNALFRKLTAINDRISVATNQTSEFSTFITTHMEAINRTLKNTSFGNTNYQFPRRAIATPNAYPQYSPSPSTPTNSEEVVDPALP